METQELIHELESRGITLTLCGQDLTYTAQKPIPHGIVTTIEAHRGALKKHLQAQPTATTASMQPDIPKAQRAADVPIGTNESVPEQGDSRPDTVSGPSESATVADSGLSAEQDGQNDVGRPTSFERLRDLLNSGQLDGRRLVVNGYPHPDIGEVTRQYFGHMDNADAEKLNAGYFENMLREVMRALRNEMNA